MTFLVFRFRDSSVPVSGNLVQKSSSSESLRCRSKEKVELTCAGFGKFPLSLSLCNCAD